MRRELKEIIEGGLEKILPAIDKKDIIDFLNAATLAIRVEANTKTKLIQEIELTTEDYLDKQNFTHPSYSPDSKLLFCFIHLIEIGKVDYAINLLEEYNITSTQIWSSIISALLNAGNLARAEDYLLNLSAKEQSPVFYKYLTAAFMATYKMSGKMGGIDAAIDQINSTIKSQENVDLSFYSLRSLITKIDGAKREVAEKIYAEKQQSEDFFKVLASITSIDRRFSALVEILLNSDGVQENNEIKLDIEIIQDELERAYNDSLRGDEEIASDKSTLEKVNRDLFQLSTQTYIQISCLLAEYAYKNDLPEFAAKLFWDIAKFSNLESLLDDQLVSESQIFGENHLKLSPILIKIIDTADKIGEKVSFFRMVDEYSKEGPLVEVAQDLIQGYRDKALVEILPNDEAVRVALSLDDPFHAVVLLENLTLNAIIEDPANWVDLLNDYQENIDIVMENVGAIPAEVGLDFLTTLFFDERVVQAFITNELWTALSDIVEELFLNGRNSELICIFENIVEYDEGI